MNRLNFSTQKTNKLSYALLLTVIFTGACFTSLAQSLSVGPKVGITSSNGAGDDLPNNVESITGFTGGIFFKIHNDGLFAFQPELLYVRKGGFWNENPTFNYELKTDYLQIPLLAKFQIPVGETVFPFIYAGPYGAFTLNKQDEGELLFFQAEDVTDLKDFDAGMALGAGLDFELSAFYLGFDARYDIGMVNIFEENSDGEQADIKNRTWSFMLSLGVNLD